MTAALQQTATHGDTRQHIAIHSNTMQHTAPHCNTLQPGKSGAPNAAGSGAKRSLYLARGLFAVDCSQSCYYPVCCSVLQCVAVCCSALQCVAVRARVFISLKVFSLWIAPVSLLPGVLQCDAVCSSVQQCLAVRCSACRVCLSCSRDFCCGLLPVSLLPGVLQCVVLCCSTLQCVAVRACIFISLEVFSPWTAPILATTFRVAIRCSVLQ